MTDYNVVSISGGKDSTALLLLAIERETENLRPVFADTGHEHPEVYAYLDYLEQRLGITIERLVPDFSAQIARKRETVQTKWRRELPAMLMADKPGQWVPRSGYKVFSGVDDEGLPIMQMETPAGVMVETFRPDDPADPYAPAQQGAWVWLPSERGLPEAEAVELAEQRIEAALAVLQPTGVPFLDLCLWKGRFPSSQARFCTEELKRNPIDNWLAPLLADPEAGEVYSWQGVRAQESASRAKLLELEEDAKRAGLWHYRPILQWTAAEVFDFHRRHNVKWNPLYEQGMGRVGCMPCINCRKDELQAIARRFPDQIGRVREWERLVSMAGKRGAATLFTATNDPTASLSDAISAETHGIDRMVEWSKTARGGRQFDLIASSAPDVGCASAYGLCDTGGQP